MAQPITNPTGCFGAQHDCCSGRTLPDLLHATVEAISGCACLTSVTIELALALDPPTGALWSGTGAFGSCGRTISVVLICVGNVACAFKLFPTISGCGFGPDLSPTNCQCDADAVNILFDNLDVFGCCNTLPPPAPRIRITITE